MKPPTDLTRWNRAGLSRMTYVDANAPAFLEFLRDALARRFGGEDESVWQVLHAVPATEDLRERLRRVESQYGADRRDVGWEIVRLFARACHILTGHVDAYVNEGFLGTATQWDNVRRLVEMLDYHPAPPASASTTVALVAKPGARGVVPKGLQMKFTPAHGPALTFETLEDVLVDDQLNEMRPAGYGRNPVRLASATLIFDGVVKHLKTGEPIVLEDDGSGALSAHVIQGVRECPDRTHVTVRPSIAPGFTAGDTIVHAEPADHLDLRGPAVGLVQEAGTTLHLTTAPDDLQAGEIVYVCDAVHAYYRRVKEIGGRIVALETALHALQLTHATLARPELISISRPSKDKGDSVVRVAGDYSRLVNARVALRDPAKSSTIAEVTVKRAVYVPVEQAEKDRDAAHTLLTIPKEDLDKAKEGLDQVQTIWIPPIGGGWPVDSYLVKSPPPSPQHVPPAVVTAKPKKLAGTDVVAMVDGDLIAWTRLASVDVDATAGQATLWSPQVWNDWQDGNFYLSWQDGNFYLSETKVYGHFKQQLHVHGWQKNATVLPRTQVTLPAPLDALRTGARVLVDATGSEPFLATVSVKGATVTLSRPLPEGCTVADLVLRGNIAGAGHGEAKSERVLGSGSAVQSNQVFLLKVADVSFIADSTQTTGVRADIAVRVDGAEWKQVSTLNDSGPTDAHYVVRMTEDGNVLIEFGDGTNGRRLPTGSNNVRVAFREGNGVGGNIPAGSLTKPAKPHALVATIRQLTPAIGGNDMETTASLRENAPASLLTLERAVSLDDFSFLAGSHSSVWQARAFAQPTGFGQREQIKIVVVPANGTPLGTLDATLKEFVLRHAVPGVDITIAQFLWATFDVTVELSVDEAAYVADDVKVAVKDALQDAFALARRRLGQDVFLSEIYKVVENVTGVEHSTVVLNNTSVLRIPIGEDTVCVLGACTVTVLRASGTAAATTSGPPAPVPAPTATSSKPIGRRDVIVIDGVGPIYAPRLSAVGSPTVQAIANMNPDTITVDMPRPLLWRAIGKAQALLELDIDISVADAVLDLPLLEIAMMTPAALSALTKAPADQVAQLRTLVRRLQAAIDDVAFTALTLREFVAE